MLKDRGHENVEKERRGKVQWHCLKFWTSLPLKLWSDTSAMIVRESYLYDLLRVSFQLENDACI